MEEIKIPVPEITQETIEKVLRRLLNEKLDNTLETVIKEQTKDIIKEEIGKGIKKVIGHLISEFASEEGYIESEDENSIKKLSIRQEFDKILNGNEKYEVSTGRDEQIYVKSSSYGSKLMDALFKEFLILKVGKFTDQWIQENKELIKTNLSTVVSNNIKKELFGTKLPDAELLSLTK